MSQSSAPLEISALPVMAWDHANDMLCRPSPTLVASTTGDSQVTRRRDTESSGQSTDLKRLRARLLQQVGDDASSEDVLEIFLCHVIDECDARHLARNLLDKFSGLGGVLTAKEEYLTNICVGHEESVALLRNAHLIMKRALREPIEDKPILKDLPALYDYLRLSMAHEKNENVRLLFLNSKNALMKDELHQQGTLNRVSVIPREIVKRVLEINANALIIVHNHPSGDPKPSAEDVAMTQVMVRVLGDIGVTLHDHIIVGHSRCESMRSLRLIYGD